MKKRILVTGSSSGIGAEVVRVLSKQRYVDAIGIHYNKNEKGSFDLKTEISDAVETRVFQCDFNSTNIGLVTEFVKEFGVINALINCAGIISSVSFDELTFNEYDKIMNVNSRATFMVTKDAFNEMKSHGGKIVNISSIATKFGIGRNKSIQYAASKATLDILTIGLARIGARYNILVNSISPGPIMSGMQEGRLDLEERKNLIPLKRFGTVADIANMVEYLISERGDFITGQIIRISGGE